MTITPDSDTLSVDPFNIEFHVGDLLQYFRISAPDSTPANTFYITWTVTGDTEPKYYAPVLNTRVEVETSGIYPVHFGTFSEVAVGGRSLPIRVYVDNSPDVTVIVNVDLFYPYGGIELSAYSLEFIAGETEKFITVSAASTVDVNTDFEARLNFSLSGSNRNAYKLDLDSVILDLSTFDYPEPKVNSVVIGSITKNSAQVNVVTNQIGTVYYAVALKGTQMPTFEEVKSQSIPDYPSTQTMYGR